MRQRNMKILKTMALLLAFFLTASGCDLDVMTRFERWSLDAGIKAQLLSIDEAIATGETLADFAADPVLLTKDQMKLELYYLLNYLDQGGTDSIVSRRTLKGSPLTDLNYWFKRFEAEVDGLEDYYVFLTQISEHYRVLHTRVLHPDEVLAEYDWSKKTDPALSEAFSRLPLTAFRYQPKVIENNRTIKEHLGSRAKNLDPGLVLKNREDVVHTGVTEDKKTAYLRIDSFMIKGLAQDGTVLGIQEFLSDLDQFDQFILDIRSNPGGFIGPWRREILPRLISEPVSVQSFLAFRNTALGERMRRDLLSILADEERRTIYDKSRAGQSAIESMIFRSTPKSPVSMVYRSYEDKAFLGDYLRIEDYIEPKDPIGFKGRIYFLMDSQVLGSADAFSHYMRELELAEMVGKPARGDGVAQSFGISRLVLPYSGLVYQVQTAYGLNGDGSSNFERGTPIDLFKENGEELDHVLEKIKKDQGGAGE